MAVSNVELSQAIKRHVGRELSCCDLEGLRFRDCICAFTGSWCISGLLMQLASKEGNVDKERAGSCGESCYYPRCYPCVVTDGCLCQCCANCDESEATLFLVRTAVRKKLVDKVGNTSDWVLPCLQQYCGICYCAPCHDAALVREIRPRGYGTLWCVGDSDSSELTNDFI